MDGFLIVAVSAAAFVGLARWLAKRRERAAAHQDPVDASTREPGHGGPPWDMDALLVLHLELEDRWPDPQVQARVRAALREAWREHLAEAGLTPGSAAWRARRDAAWRAVSAGGSPALGTPPWEDAGSAAPAEEPLTWEIETPLPAGAQTTGASASELPGLTAETLSLVYPRRIPALAGTEEGSPSAGTAEFALTPHAPSTMERALGAITRWPKLAAPFLAQNVGWFIGGFCFVAGSLFLVSYTRGVSNALAVLGCLALYTTALLWGGYQLRRRRPELQASSAVLLTIAVLLIPLDFTALANLLALGAGRPGVLAAGAALALLALSGAYFGARLATGMMDRSLPNRHAGALTALAALQLVAPLLASRAHWIWLAAAHLALAATLGYAIRAFCDTWVREIFVERRRVAWYGAGVLVFAALISFGYLAWRFGGGVPGGYAGPFVMLLAGALFYVDAKMKAWAGRHPFLSRFTFAVYGLSVLAVVAAFDDPGARALTLGLGTVIYGALVRQYLTATPLYLLLAALAGLYATVVLGAVAPALSLIAALPGLALVVGAQHWTRRRSRTVARGCVRGLTALTLGAGAWSLYHAGVGLVASGTALVMAGVVHYSLYTSPALLPRARRRRALYAVGGLLALASASAPALPGLGHALTSAWLLLVLALAWSWRALRNSGDERTECRLNSALLAIAGALLLAGMAWVDAKPPAAGVVALLAVAAAALAWLGLGLRLRLLVYGAMLTAAVAGALTRQVYFPGPSVGLAEALAALALWVFLRTLNRTPSPERAERDALRLARRAPVTVLWTLPASTP